MREFYRESLRESDDESILANEIAGLELQLAKAKQRLNAKRRAATTTATTATTTATTTTASVSETAASSEATDSSARPTPLTSARTTPVVAPSPATATATATATMMADSSHHYLLLLSDSALPLGSFAFSSGLESYLAHARPSTSLSSSSSSSSTLLYKPSFASFLPLSLSSYASTTLPFALAAHRAPSALARLDDALDASIVCAVGRRASTAQGRALLSIWEKSLAPSSSSSSSSSSSTDMEARGALESYSAALRHASRTTTTTTTTNGSGSGSGSSSSGRDVDVEALPPLVSAHLAPLFGAVARLLGLTAHQAAYVFLLGHAKALVSAAVRAGMFGPYQAQKVLAGAGLRALVADLVAREWDVPVARAAQSVPVMDLWVGRHEMLYSRIFNS
ncbi:putative urease accessory protein [Rosellinia necatrix]|uniref:Putative urease accessory protein n=1 Tax=Rosellinia necatrix TaxID=77044 RepID=A0A1S8A5S0_ROSNE|nr:putative urease accessory protein [Rosellinia necatrix]